MRDSMQPTVSLQVLSAAGAVNHEELVKMATDAFGGVPDEEPTSSVRALVAKVGACAAVTGHTRSAIEQPTDAAT
jgi:hypothetical protein